MVLTTAAVGMSPSEFFEDYLETAGAGFKHVPAKSGSISYSASSLSR